jgi:5-methylcytosine-specific restriction endonuclease McrA
MARININWKIRQEIFARDNWICQKCGRKLFPIDKKVIKFQPTIDHIIPLSKGGKEEKENYQTLCKGCNSKKYTKNNEMV